MTRDKMIDVAFKINPQTKYMWNRVIIDLKFDFLFAQNTADTAAYRMIKEWHSFLNCQMDLLTKRITQEII